MGSLQVKSRHRLLCGDSTKAEDVERLMGGKVAELMVTDPPYGVSYEGTPTTKRKPIQNDNIASDETEALIKNSMTLSPIGPGSSYYIFAPSGHPYPWFWAGIESAGLKPRHQLAWVKDRMVFGRSDYHYQHESIIYGWKPGQAHYFIDDRTQTTVWEYPKPSSSKEHPTMKPIPVIERCIKNSSQRGWLVYDPFLGSGTTLIASTNLGRKCYGLEIDPGYCDVIVERWESLTGKKAVRP